LLLRSQRKTPVRYCPLFSTLYLNQFGPHRFIGCVSAGATGQMVRRTESVRYGNTASAKGRNIRMRMPCQGSLGGTMLRVQLKKLQDLPSGGCPHTSLIAATSTGFTLWPSRNPMALSSPAAYPNRSSPDPPSTQDLSPSGPDPHSLELVRF
jgi:hypothetical protein